MYFIVTVVRFVIILIKFYVCMYVCMYCLTQPKVAFSTSLYIHSFTYTAGI